MACSRSYSFFTYLIKITLTNQLCWDTNYLKFTKSGNLLIKIHAMASHITSTNITKLQQQKPKVNSELPHFTLAVRNSDHLTNWWGWRCVYLLPSVLHQCSVLREFKASWWTEKSHRKNLRSNMWIELGTSRTEGHTPAMHLCQFLLCSLQPKTTYCTLIKSSKTQFWECTAR